MDAWIGEHYERTTDRIMILGESWPGEVEPLAMYLPRWASREINDTTFARLFNAASGWNTKHATLQQRLDWWNSIAFYNFVPGSCGPTRSHRPTRAMFAAAREPLAAVLVSLRPRGVWILGTGQAEYSVEVVSQFGIVYEVTRHPTSYGLRSADLSASWHRLVAMARAAS